jgi:Fe-S cluster assembly scaffold protein SufB
VWSGGSFVYVPAGVRVDIPLQAYFRINSDNMGQFERTLIIAEEGSYVHYIEGCTAPTYSSDSLHSAVVEIIAHKNSHVRYTTIQNWSDNVYNLVTKRAIAYEGARVEWIDGNLGCLAAGTQVWTSHGLKAIEDIRPGEVVRSYTEGGWVQQSVVAAKQNPPRPTWRMELADGRFVIATDNHPFRAFTGCFDRGWVPLRDLAVGDLLACTLTPVPDPAAELALVAHGPAGKAAEDGAADVHAFIPIVSIDTAGERVTFDLEVEDTANFVANGVAAHNSKITMKYPAIYLMGERAHGEVLSAAFAGDGQHQDAGAKCIHVAPHTTSQIISRSISKGTGRTSYRGHIKVYPKAHDVKVNVRCDALLLDSTAQSDTYPYMDVENPDVEIGHEATVSKVGEEQIFYLMSRGMSEADATTLIVNGFFEPFVKELPMEYAVELNRLLAVQMEGSVG